MSRPHVTYLGPAGADPVGHFDVRAADGLDAVEIKLRFDGRRGTASALKLLAKASIELLVHARAVEPLPSSREMEGARWNG